MILDSGERLVSAKSKAQLERWIEKLEITDEGRRDIIDSNGEGFAYYPKLTTVTPSIGVRRWKKLQIIDLYDLRRPTGSSAMKRASLSSRTLEDIVFETVELLQQSTMAK